MAPTEQPPLLGFQREDFAYIPWGGILGEPYTLDSNLPALRTPREKADIHQPPKYGLGNLDAMPLELLHSILPQLDILSITRFRRLNRQAREIVDSVPQYKALRTHTLHVLRSILLLGAGQWHTCDTLYKTLCTPWCTDCGDFGDYLYIPSNSRVCLSCFTKAKKYLPLRHTDALRVFGLTHEALRSSARMMRSVAGTYTTNRYKRNERFLLVDAESGRAAGIQLHGSAEAMEQHVADVQARKQQAYEERLAAAKKAASVPVTRRLRRPRAEEDVEAPEEYAESRVRAPRAEERYDHEETEPLRYMAVVRMPWLDRRSERVEKGFYCAACRNGYNGTKNWWRKFSVASFDEHLKVLGGIRDRVHHSDLRGFAGKDGQVIGDGESLYARYGSTMLALVAEAEKRGW
ncbi:unnamed protein product [Periconia digitata]|uniref:F-box domain-containing protein n=1 Tax=Periconia digitata TaxID=1303443 RepID=A0A9W4URH3_9PLEO|nr:unnamed protein product [Periconia digitata]